jgi:osmoprotectant transport system ATP-binding protein
MREGGWLAQFGTPAELLMRPADDYVARFLGPDRALKRLALIQAGALPLEPVLRGAGFRDELPSIPATATAREALAAALASPARAAMVVDAAGRPAGVATLAAIGAVLGAEERAALRRQA